MEDLEPSQAGKEELALVSPGAPGGGTWQGTAAVLQNAFPRDCLTWKLCATCKVFGDQKV